MSGVIRTKKIKIKIKIKSRLKIQTKKLPPFPGINLSIDILIINRESLPALATLMEQSKHITVPHTKTKNISISAKYQKKNIKKIYTVPVPQVLTVVQRM